MMRTLALLSIFSFIVLVTPGTLKAAYQPSGFRNHITCELFYPEESTEEQLLGDCCYHNLISASDGRIYFGIGTHNANSSARLYRFNPATNRVKRVAKISEVLGVNPEKQVSEGKLHTPLFEHKKKLWFATDLGFYYKDLPPKDYGVREAYRGAHFMSYDMKAEQCTDLAQIFPHEGIISMIMDKKNEILYGLTWPAGILVSYDIETKDMRYWGATQGRGEWGHRDYKFQSICRTLAVDPDGYVYGSTMDGLIWKFDRSEVRPVSYINGIDLSKVPLAQAEDPSKHSEMNIYWRTPMLNHNWRVIRWNSETDSFWGLHHECSTLFEFVPSRTLIRSIADLKPQAYRTHVTSPRITQMGFIIGPDKKTLFYLAHAPCIKIEGRPDIQSSLNLITYDIKKGRYKDHGPILSTDNRRVFFGESIAIGSDDHIYSVVWVEVIDPGRLSHAKAARQAGSTGEARKTIYEMMLMRLPKWFEFTHETPSVQLP
ncbi:MAG: hypothetical protein ACYTFW_03035 [Planctomycetota bacterium]|jgi:outer membrane protein assembly factor BamB